MVVQSSDRFVWRSDLSQQLVLMPLAAVWCLGVRFPLITCLGEMRQGEKAGRVCAAEVFSNLAGCGQLDRRFEFLLTARLKFQPLKIGGNKRFGFSKQPRRVVFFSRPFLIFPVPVPSSRPHLGSDGLWYDSKCDYVKIFYSKFPPQHSFSDESAGFTAVRGTAWFTWLGLFLDRNDGVLPDLESAISPCFSVASVFGK